MAKPRKQKQQSAKSRGAYPPVPGDQPAKPASSQATRETIESIVIAFVLAFLFRTFEAEAFVIPTGSMSPALQGRHKDVECPECGYRYRVTASEEAGDEIEMLQHRERNPRLSPLERIEARETIPEFDVVAGMCPMCRYTMPMRPDLPVNVPDARDADAIEFQPSYNGDRILVNKYAYSFRDPERWDVVVFKFPGNAQMNYIKRLVGLPDEVLRIYQGDLFVRPREGGSDFAIARKPPDKILAMRQAVHDTDFEPATLYEAGWPLRWQPWPENGGVPRGWKVDVQVDDGRVAQRFASDPEEDEVAWLRYLHTIPDEAEWEAAKLHQPGQPPDPTLRAASRPQLVSDFNPYNARVTRRMASEQGSLDVPAQRQGIHWVSDLIVDVNVQIKKPSGIMLVDLVEGGRHFTARFDLASGEVRLTIEGLEGFSPSAKTPLSGPGNYLVTLANVDDQLLLWIDGDLVAFEGATTYDADAVFGARSNIRPESDRSDPGDLAPVGIGVQSADLVIDRLRVCRDIYYIADRWDRDSRPQLVTDYPAPYPWNGMDYLSNPARWNVFLDRQKFDFPLDEDQYFVMGDNSPESQDARLWKTGQADRGVPGGAYLERRLLIGKALCVYWPHAWYHVPGTPIPVFPNIMDMRLVR